MPYIGSEPSSGLFQELDALTASATDDYTLKLNGADFFPETVNNLLVSINGVIQGGSTMALNGAVLTVGATLSSSDTIDFVRVFGNVGSVSTPTDGSVTANKIGSGAVNLTSKVTGVLPVANGGTGSSLGGNAPYWSGRLASNQTISRTTLQTITGFSTNEIDSSSSFDGTTFTVPSGGAGTYFINTTILFYWGSIGNDGEEHQTKIVHTPSGGSATTIATGRFTILDPAKVIHQMTVGASVVFPLGVGDTLIVRAYAADNNGGGGGTALANDTNFGGFRIGA